MNETFDDDIVMTTEVTLTFTDGSGRERRVAMRSNRLTVGRDAANDLAINDSNLSRHHAVFETKGGSILVSDCNSRNGTMLNGNPILGAVEVFDGDVINLAGACEISVEVRKTAQKAPLSLSLPAIAAAAVALILLVAGVLFALFVGNKKPEFTSNGNANSKAGSRYNERHLSPTLQPTPTDGVPKNPEDESNQIVVAVKRVMSKVSKDSAPYISEAGLKDVKRKVEEYRGSSDLRERFRAAKRGCPEISAEAERISLRPALVLYAALAESEGQAGGNAITAARTMAPRLLSLRATFGTETANSTLLLIAAYPYPFNPVIGSQTRTPHPLAAKLVEIGGRKSTVETSEARTVWFLREKNAISEQAYDLVIRFLAIGVIAENPGRYGIDVEPVLC